jgi:hypothetical protein
MFEKTEQMRQENYKILSLFKKWQRAWDMLKAESAAAKPDAAVMKQCATQLTGWIEYFQDYQSTWQELRDLISKQYQFFTQKYEGELREACNQLNYFVEGEFPSLTADGLIKIRLDKEANIAIVNGKKTSSLSINVVVERIRSEHKRIWERELDLSLFTSQLRNAYQTIRQEKSTREGEYLSLREIYQYLKTTRKSYPLDLFAADLSRLLENGSLLSTIEIAPVRDPKKAIYIFNRKNHSSRYIGLIRFK